MSIQYHIYDTWVIISFRLFPFTPTENSSPFKLEHLWSFSHPSHQSSCTKACSSAGNCIASELAKTCRPAVGDESLMKMFIELLLMEESCTSWQVAYPIIYKVLHIPGGAGFLLSTMSPLPGKINCWRWTFIYPNSKETMPSSFYDDGHN